MTRTRDRSFDVLHQPVGEFHPELPYRSRTWSYDSAGGLTSVGDEDGRTTSFTQDSLRRVKSVTRAGLQNGSRWSLQVATYTFEHDRAGRVTRERTEESGVAVALETRYAYDPDGAVSSLIYPSGLRLELVRDAATREVVAIVEAATGLQLTGNVVHAPGGPVESMTFGNGLTLAQSFNRRSEPLAVTSGPVALGYAMTAAGNVSSITAGSTTRTFQYDHLDELTGSTNGLAYTYDSAGNRTSDTVDGTSYFHYYTGDRVTQSLSNSPANRPLVYGYDRQTNVSALAQKPSGQPASAACLRHDPLGRLVLVGTTAASSVTADALACLTDASVIQPVAQFKYDARARRVARWLAATNEWTYVVSDAAGNPLSELALTGDPANPWRKVRDYVWLDGRPLAQIEYPGPSGGVGGYVNYVHVDHIGLPRALTNASRQIVWSAAPRPYGDLVETTTTDPLSGRTIVTNLRLPGQYDERLFAAAGLSGMQGPYYNWNRWYLPSMGRHMELDPVALAGEFNEECGPDWYNYALGNPLRWTDLMGLEPECPPGWAKMPDNTANLGEGPPHCYKQWEPPKPPPPELPEWECLKRCSSGMSPWPLMGGRFLGKAVGRVTSSWGIGTKIGCAVYCSQKNNYCPKMW